MTTFKNNIVLRAYLEHSESWQLEDRQMGRGRVSLRAKGQLFQPKFLISIYHSMLYLTQRRGEAEFAEVIPLLEHVFVFTNWVK